jgi:glycosyltransferase involved in cell wall biosynthesis
MKIALVLPVHNEEKMLGDVLKSLSKVNLPIFLVNDGSTDKTLMIARQEARKNPRIVLISHQINLGKGAAVKTGCIAAFNKKFDAVIFMDSDGQHDPKDLNKFREKLITGKYDVILGSRNLHHGVPLVRFLGNKFASLLISILFGVYVSDILCGFRAVTKKGFSKINLESSGYGIETEMIVKISKYNLKSCEVPIETIYHDKHKGVTFLDAFYILFDVFRWRIVL